MVSVKLYVEGGGNTSDLKAKCRKGFRELLEKSGFRGRLPRVVACGPRESAFDRFKSTIGKSSEYAILLVDSEDPLASGRQISNPSGAWDHLEYRDGWQRPHSAHNDQAQLMVTCMETWLMADRGAIIRHFPGVNQGALLPDVGLENRTREDVYSALNRATSSSPKGHYRKERDSFDLLAMIDPTELRGSLPHFQRFLDALDSHL